MSRAFCIPGVFFLFFAFVLSLLASISLPFLPALDITRTHFGAGAVQGSNQTVMSELRVCFILSYPLTEQRADNFSTPFSSGSGKT